MTVVDVAAVEASFASILPNARVLAILPLDGGFSHATFQIKTDATPQTVVLKCYDGDPVGCLREARRLQSLRRIVPVPDVLDVQLEDLSPIAPFLLLTFVEGMTFRKLKATGDAQALLEAARSVGEVLGKLATFDTAVATTVEPSPIQQSFLASPTTAEFTAAPLVVKRLGDALLDSTLELISTWAPELALQSTERSMVHGDLNKRNMLVGWTAAGWAVTAVLDWESAFLGPSLTDIGSFLRYERSRAPTAEPAFSRVFQEAGGCLPAEWRPLSRVLDLQPLLRILAADGVPAEIVVEVVDLVRATIEGRDPN